MNYKAAIDFSGKEIVLAVSANDELLFENNRILTGREASTLLSWITEKLENNRLEINNISKWIVGVGPGNFTGMRIISSLVAGFAFNKNCEAIGYPSYYAFAEFAYEGESISVLYDARKKELISYKLRKKGEELILEEKEYISSADDFKSDEKYFALESDKTTITNILSEELLSQINFIETLPIRNLLFLENVKEEPITELTYTRPAVY